MAPAEHPLGPHSPSPRPSRSRPSRSPTTTAVTRSQPGARSRSGSGGRSCSVSLSGYCRSPARRGRRRPRPAARGVRWLGSPLGRLGGQRRGHVRRVQPHRALPRDLHARRPDLVRRLLSTRSTESRSGSADRRGRPHEPVLPGSFPGRGLAEELPSAATRLSFPLGYWNGLGVFLGLGFRLLVYSAAARRREGELGRWASRDRGRRLSDVVPRRRRGDRARDARRRPRPPSARPRARRGLGAARVARDRAVASRHALVDGPLGSAAARTKGREAAVAVCWSASQRPSATSGSPPWFREPAARREACAWRPSSRAAVVVGGARRWRARSRASRASRPPPGRRERSGRTC